MPDLVPVHGGLEAPVSRTVPLSRRQAFLDETMTDADWSKAPRAAVRMSPLAAARRPAGSRAAAVLADHVKSREVFEQLGLDRLPPLFA